MEPLDLHAVSKLLWRVVRVGGAPSEKGCGNGEGESKRFLRHFLFGGWKVAFCGDELILARGFRKISFCEGKIFAQQKSPKPMGRKGLREKRNRASQRDAFFATVR